MKFLISILAITFATALSAQQPAFISDSLDIYILREMARWNIPGVAISIVKDGETIVSKGYGVTDIKTKQPVDENTLFMIASNSKLFTGTSLALLQEQGRLNLEDKVQTYLPYFHMYSDTLTKRVGVNSVEQ